MRSCVRTPEYVCMRFAFTGRLQALLNSPGALLGRSWALQGSPGARLGSEIVQMACQEPEPRAREGVMRSRVRTLANFCIRFARTGRLQALQGSPGALLGSPGLSWGSPGALQGSEIFQMACRELQPRAREDGTRSRVRTPAIFCIRSARTGRLQALLGSPGASWALLGYPGFSLALKSSKWHARRRSLARARMSCDHASGPRQISAYVSLAQGGSKLSWALMGLSRGSPRLSWGSPGF
jgi:hypothetical protein